LGHTTGLARREKSSRQHSANSIRVEEFQRTAIDLPPAQRRPLRRGTNPQKKLAGAPKEPANFSAMLHV
jgi:hypothetical protein